MNLNNVVEYIKSGTLMTRDSKRSKILVSGAGLVTLIAVIPGIVLGGHWIYILGFMVISFLISAITVFVLSSKKSTIKTMLISQLVICINWILQIVLLQTIFFTMSYGWRADIILLYAPIVLFPLIFAFIHCKKLKKENSFLPSKEVPWQVGIIGGISGYAGIRLARILDDVSQSTMIVVILIAFLLFATILSLGLLNIQRLYYLKKYTQTGLLTEDVFEFEPFQKN